MQYKLVRKGINEIVDTVNTIGDREAKQYFQLKKQLEKEIFEKLYKVEKDDGDRLTRV